MFVQVNGVRLYFDVEGAGLVPDGAGLREKPTLVLLHGGPGFDHALFKPAFSVLADIAQVIYYDHRGNGRSGGDDKSTWTLAQWGDDVKGLCDALGIERPIVWGHSFGGFVAQAYATRHPEHPAKLILANTAARVDFEQMFAAFERVGGPKARDLARAYWLTPTAESRAKFLETCFPLYRARPDVNSVGEPQHHEGRGRADVQRPEQRAGPDGLPPGSRAREVSDPGDGRRARSGDADAVQRDDRRKPAAASRALRALPRQRPCSRCSTSRKRRSA